MLVSFGLLSVERVHSVFGDGPGGMMPVNAQRLAERPS